MLEWLDVRLDIRCDKRLTYEYRTEPLNRDKRCAKTRMPSHSHRL